MEFIGNAGTGIVVEEDDSAEGNKCRTRFAFNIEFILPVLPENDLVQSYLDGQEKDESHIWYYNNRKVSEVGRLYRAFLRFYELNKENKHACYIVGLKKAANGGEARVKVTGPRGSVTENFVAPEMIKPTDETFEVAFDTIKYNVDYQTNLTEGKVMNYIEVHYQQMREITNDAETPVYQKRQASFEIDQSGRTEVILGDLVAGHDYTFEQRLVSRISRVKWAVGPWSDPYTVTTSISSPPRSLKSKAIKETSIEVTWQSPTKVSKDIALRYEVTVYKDICSGTPVKEEEIVGNSINVDNLESATNYCFTVKAVNDRNPNCFFINQEKKIVSQTCVHDTEAKLSVSTETSPPDGFYAECK